VSKVLGQAKRIVRNALQLGAAWTHRGDVVECPCCRRAFADFLPQGSRTSAKCPRCWSLERHRSLWLFLLDRGLPRAGATVLHIAPEDALWRNLRRRDITYIAADIAGGSRTNAQFDLTRAPLPDSSVDLLLMGHVLEHIPDEGAALHQMLRILRPDGLAVLQHPIDYSKALTEENPAVTSPEERERLYGQNDHVRAYGRDFPDRIAAAGFIVEKVDFPSELPNGLAHRYGLFENNPSRFLNGDIYVCSPRAGSAAD
jgi:SAM-dependent methyltransferase